MKCIFCDIVNKKSPSWTVYQDDDISAFFDYYPASRGHILIVPNKHYENIFDTPKDILSKIIKLSKRIAMFYKKEMWISNINIVQSNWIFAGQEVFHYHMHLIPRWENDNVNLHWDHDEDHRDEYDELKKFVTKWIK